jgi:hypothetical protein
VTGGWRKLHNKDLRDVYSSPSIIRIIKLRRVRWAGHVVRMGEKSNAYRALVGKPEGKSPLRWPILKWVNNIRMDLGDIVSLVAGRGLTGWVWLRIGTSGELVKVATQLVASRVVLIVIRFVVKLRGFVDVHDYCSERCMTSVTL